MDKKNDLTGMIFSRWTILSSPISIKGYPKVLCKCECGVVRYVDLYQLKKGNSRSCGCYSISLHSGSNNHGFIHGDCVGTETTEYNTWLSIKQRCYSVSFKSYKNYGGRGIIVCERWLNSFNDFLSDMGRKPSPHHSIDRFPNNDGNYEPSNCRWATPKEQCNNTRHNRRVSLYGENKTISEWSAITRIQGNTIIRRLNCGWPILAALSSPKVKNQHSVSKVPNIQHTFGWVNEVNI